MVRLFEGISTPQLLEIKRILEVGVLSTSEKLTLSATSQLCHKSPPKGYPKEKSDYGDPSCYRYPLNTKARCVAAWRYVHQKDNWSLLGDKAKTVESHIKSYAKKHYNLDLQTGESVLINWEKEFLEYYDAETMGERAEVIDLEKEEEMTEEIKEVDTLKAEVKTKTDELSVQSTKIDELTKELTSLRTEVETLRKFKTDTEEAAAKAQKIKLIKTKLVEAGVEADVDAEADYWLGMNEDVLTKTIAKLSDLIKKVPITKASAEKEEKLKVPPVVHEETDKRKIVAEGFKEHKQASGKK